MEGKKKELTKYHVDLPSEKVNGETQVIRISYGFDPEDAEDEGNTGYYISVSDTQSGKTIVSRGFSDVLEGGEMLILLEKHIPDTLKGPSVERLAEHKGLIAAGLPF